MPWRQLLDVLELPEPAALQLPTRTTCTCGQTLKIYQDRLLGGAWFVCRNCDFAGDGVELAARTWQLAPDAALLRLSQFMAIPDKQLAPHELECYVQEQIGYRRHIRRFWQTLRTRRPHSSTTQMTLLRKLGANPCDMDADVQFERYSQFMGYTSRNELEEVFGGTTGPVRQFRGRNWGDLLAFPFQDLPGRIVGFLCVGRDGEAADWAYRPVVYGNPVTNQWGPAYAGIHAGFGMLDLCLRAQPIDEKVCVVHDPAAAIRLQFRQLRQSTRPLPIVIGWQGRWHSEHIRDVFPTRKLVHWSPHQLDKAIWLAARTDSDVSLAEPRQSDMTLYLNRLEPEVLLRRCINKARPWQDVLETQLASGTAEANEELLLRLNLPAEALTTFLTTLPAVVQRQCQLVTKRLEIPSAAVIGHRHIVEQDGQWIDQRTEVVLCNAALKIEQITTDQQTGKLFYSGHVGFKGHNLPFLMSEHDARTPLMWMERFLANHGLGPLHYVPNLGNSVLTASKLLYKPQIVSGLGVTGWSTQHNAFLFPGRQLSANGKLVDAPAQLWSPDTPGHRLRFHAIPVATIDRLSEQSLGVSTLWATLVSILQCAIAPALRRRVRHTAIVGQVTGDMAFRVAEACGCKVYNLRGWVATYLERINRDASLHNWPQYVRCHWGRMQESPQLHNSLPAGTLVETSPPCAAALKLLDHWNILEAPDALYRAEELLDGVDTLIPAYLQDLTIRRLRLPQGELEPALFSDLQVWWKRIGGNAAGLLGAIPLLITPHSSPPLASRLGDLLARLYLEGHMGLHRDQDTIPRTATMLSLLPRGELHIPKTGLNRALLKYIHQPLDLALVQLILQGNGLLIADRTHGEEPGWIVPWPWLEARLRAQKSFLEPVSIA